MEGCRPEEAPGVVTGTVPPGVLSVQLALSSTPNANHNSQHPSKVGAEVATASDEETGAAQPSPHGDQDSGPSSPAGPVFSAITLAVEPVAHLPQGLAFLQWLVQGRPSPCGCVVLVTSP